MSAQIKSIENLINEFKKLPGMSLKAVKRTFFLLKQK